MSRQRCSMQLAHALTTVTLGLWLLFYGQYASAADSDAGSPPTGERSLPERYTPVVNDALRLCQPTPGFWVDLGAGKGPVALALIEATDNAVVMVDPNADAMAEGLRAARDKGVERRIAAVVGVAEALPFPDNTVDLIVSRGSIFFWDDPVKGLREVDRVLRPGGKAYIGGGAGSGYPKAEVARLIQMRKQKLTDDANGKWRRFVELRRPEQMKNWAEQARLSAYRVLGQGAIDDDDEIGQGVWLLYEKPRSRD